MERSLPIENDAFKWSVLPKIMLQEQTSKVEGKKKEPKQRNFISQKHISCGKIYKVINNYLCEELEHVLGEN